MALHTLGPIVLGSLVLGACLGSFLNLCFVRIPQGKSILRPASHCPHCAQPVRPWLNLPLLGYLLTRGRCRDCQAPLSSSYWLVELGCGLLFAALALRFGHDLVALIHWQILSFLLLACGGIDLACGLAHDENEGIIPDGFSLGGLVLGLALAIWQQRLQDALLGAVIGGGIPLALYWFYRIVRRIEALGLGDVKMLAMIGAFGGVPAALVSMVAGSLSGLLGALLFALAGRGTLSMRMKIPFGPFLALGGLIFIFVWGTYAGPSATTHLPGIW